MLVVIIDVPPQYLYTVHGGRTSNIFTLLCDNLDHRENPKKMISGI